MAVTTPSFSKPTTQTNQSSAGNFNSFLEGILPGSTNLTSSATSVIGNLLNGLPSPGQARTANAYWGAGAGTPAGGSGNAGGVNTFIGNRGADLYNQQAQQAQQTGLGNLLQTIGTYTSPALANQGQNMQASEAAASLAQNQSQFEQNYQLQQFEAMLQALSLGKGGAQGNIQTPQISGLPSLS